MRNGKQFLASIEDKRRFYLEGKVVDSVHDHPAFRGVAKTIAELYDFSADPANDMIFDSPETGAPANKIYMIPRSVDDLRQRREAITRWAELTGGLIGRSPDHVGALLAGIMSAPDVFEGEGGRPDSVAAFYKKVLDEDLFVTYVIVPPSGDKSVSAGDQEVAFSQVGVLEEKSDGIVVRGAQMLATAAAVSNYLFVSCMPPLKPGEEHFAVSFAVPIDTPGLKFYCRPPYATNKPRVYDYPLSTQYDETDALVVFDDVFIPWNDVFICRNIQMTRAQFHETAAHVLANTQAQTRLVVKLKLLIGVARKIAANSKIDTIPAVQSTLGDLASMAGFIEGMVLAAEMTATPDKFGVAKPNPRFLYGAMGQQAEVYTKALSLVRELAGGGIFEVPSSYHELMNADTAADFERYVRSPDGSAVERIKLMRFAWDLIGTEFGGRHLQYEMFYAGAAYVAKGYAFRFYGYEEAVAQVDKLLDRYDIDTIAPGAEAPSSPA